jgi:uncharacterized protein YndB with AHSA1/START domain
VWRAITEPAHLAAWFPQRIGYVQAFGPQAAIGPPPGYGG